jgi:hypothetical protein
MLSGHVRRSITATLAEDAHLGSGMGGSGIDSLVARDRSGRRAVIWASHIEGLLRDAAHTLHGEIEAKRLFGERGRTRQEALFTSLYSDPDPTFRVWRASARAAFDNRSPSDDTLRAIEFVAKETNFCGQMEMPEKDYDVYDRLFKEIDAVGSGRAPGAGRVRLVLGNAVDCRPRSIAGSPRGRLLLVLRNLDPLCITAMAMPGNLIPTLPFIPGRTLLGAMAAWLFAEGKQNIVQNLVDGSGSSVGDALPLPAFGDGTDLSQIEILPAPLALQSEKPGGTSSKVPWWALSLASPRRVNADPDRDNPVLKRPKLKRPEPDRFIYRIGASDWSAFRPSVGVRLRNGRPEGPTQLDPSLFAIEQIAEQTFFLAEITGNVAVLSELAQALAPVLEGRR